MRVIQHPNNIAGILNLYDLIRRAPTIEQRGQRVRHVRDVAIVLDAAVPPITSFRARKLNLHYAKQEWLWYLRADPMDDSIQEHAKAWAKLKQPDGAFYSNYGQYIFRQPGPTHVDPEADYQDLPQSQFDYVVSTLLQDPGSRRACMVLLKREHLFEANSDVVCTYAISFSIEDGHLDMTVLMRSNDVIFGFTNDAFCFWNLYQFVYTVLKSQMPHLQTGSYTHFANSMHVYERHFDMIRELHEEGSYGYTKVVVPQVTLEEVKDFINHRDGAGNDGSYTAWLKAND